jgi:hypothetical protein
VALRRACQAIGACCDRPVGYRALAGALGLEGFAQLVYLLLLRREQPREGSG